MKFCFILFIPLIFFSCAPAKIIPLKGNYPQTPIEYSSQKQFDEVWDNLVDLFAQKGLSIKIIDRSSGLIISEKSTLPATIEDKDGLPTDKTAFVVIPKFKNAATNRYEPVSGTKSGAYAKTVVVNPVYGEWNARIKKSTSGSIINVNITNVYYDVYNFSTKSYSQVALNTHRTTGVFEKIIYELIK